MRHIERMRYYQPFPAAIPQWEAGCPRVTHPSATKLKSSVRKHHLIVPFDLHVLGTPPAFILSQDQTLMLKSLHLLGDVHHLNMKSIRHRMDLASILYPFTELGCSNSAPRSKGPVRFKLVTIHVLWISSFAALAARPLRSKAAGR